MRVVIVVPLGSGQQAAACPLPMSADNRRGRYSRRTGSRVISRRNYSSVPIINFADRADRDTYRAARHDSRFRRYRASMLIEIARVSTVFVHRPSTEVMALPLRCKKKWTVRRWCTNTLRPREFLGTPSTAKRSVVHLIRRSAFD